MCTVGPTKHATNMPVSISEMDPWYFWARPDAIGLPDDVAAIIKDGEPTPDQFMLARDKMLEAKEALISAPAFEPQYRRPS